MIHLALLFACGEPHSHPHDGDHAHDHSEGKAEPAKAGAIEAPLGAYTARLEPGAEKLRLVVVDADGKAAAAEGEARVVLTGAGEEGQRLVLTADEGGWSGAAKAAGAKGYTAVVSVQLGGDKQVARLTWGEVSEAPPEAAGHDGHKHGEGHKHGGAHKHSEGDKH